MGCGLYDLLGWGVLDPPWPVDADNYIDDNVYDALEDLGLRREYETHPAYLVVPLAISDALLQEWWHLPALPAWVPRVEPYGARRLRGHQREVTRLAVARGVDLAEIWQGAQARAQALGMILGAPALLLISDYD